MQLQKQPASSLIDKDTKTGHYVWQPGLDADKDGIVNIDKELKPRLIPIYLLRSQQANVLL